MEPLTFADEVNSRSQRPFGVWFLTVYALIFAGLAPVLLGVFLLATGSDAGNAISILISIPFSLAVIRHAVGAWQGKERSRRSLLVYVTLHYVFVAINNYLLLDSPLLSAEEHTRLWGRIIRGVLYPGIYI